MKYRISFIFILFVSINSFAQKQSALASLQADKRWSALINNNDDPKRIIKFDVIPFVKRGVAIGFEHKIGKVPLSYYGYLDIRIVNDSRDGFFDLERLSSLQKEDFRASWKSDFGIRYYYNKNQRMRKGKNTNGFSSNYFSLSLLAYNPTSVNTYWGLLDYEISEQVLAAPFVGYGIKRRLEK